MTYVTTRTIRLDTPADSLFDFVSRAESLPKWAINFCKEVRPDGDDWIAITEQGDVPLRIESDAHLGVVDYIVGGQRNPTRIVSLGPDRSAYAFTLVQPPGMPEDAWPQFVAGLDDELQHLAKQLGVPAVAPT